MSTYETAVERLYALGHELANTPSEHFNLAYMRAILRELGDPQRRFPSVLIAGTNGKGSTAATLASILRVAGHRTGLYISPHLLRVNERIRINGEEIGEAQFGEIHQRVEAVARRLVEAGELPWHPSFFEVLTAMAFDYFAGAGVEIAILEVGMGGRLDATNVVEPVISVITDIALDHQNFLGNTITQIAREKAGIIRPGGVVVTLPQHPEANDVIGNTIAERGAHAVSAVPYVPPVSPGAKEVPGVAPNGVRTSYPLRVMGEEIVVDSPLVGRHQLRNIALAIAAAEELNRAGFRVTARDIERGIRETRWPGRFQRIAATAGLAGDHPRRSPQSGGSLGAARGAFGICGRASAGAGVWRDARQGRGRDCGDPVPAGRARDRHARRQPALGQPGGDTGSRRADGGGDHHRTHRHGCAPARAGIGACRRDRRNYGLDLCCRRSAACDRVIESSGDRIIG